MTVNNSYDCGADIAFLRQALEALEAHRAQLEADGIKPVQVECDTVAVRVEPTFTGLPEIGGGISLDKLEQVEIRVILRPKKIQG